MRVFDGNEPSKEGWIPAAILDITQTSNAIFGDRADDAAYQREYITVPTEGNSTTTEYYYWWNCNSVEVVFPVVPILTNHSH